MNANVDEYRRVGLPSGRFKRNDTIHLYGDEPAFMSVGRKLRSTAVVEDQALLTLITVENGFTRRLTSPASAKRHSYVEDWYQTAKSDSLRVVTIPAGHMMYPVEDGSFYIPDVIMGSPQDEPIPSSVAQIRFFPASHSSIQKVGMRVEVRHYQLAYGRKIIRLKSGELSIS